MLSHLGLLANMLVCSRLILYLVQVVDSLHIFEILIVLHFFLDFNGFISEDVIYMDNVLFWDLVHSYLIASVNFFFFKVSYCILGSKVHGWMKRNYLGREEIAKIIDDTYR